MIGNKPQEKYGNGAWRFSKKILNRIKHFFRKSKNVIEYYTSLISTLKFNVLNNVERNWRVKLNFLAYEKLQHKVEYKFL